MKFMLLFQGGDPTLTVSAPASEEKNRQMKRWGDWTADLARKGILLSACPFAENGKIVAKTGIAEFRKRKADYSGYAILEVPSEHDAITLAGTAPHIIFGGTTLIRSCL